MAVYFIQAGEDGPIKIGTTIGNPTARLSQLQTGHHETLNLIKTVEGDASTEKIIHKALAAYRLRGEWFKPDYFVLQYIESITKPQTDTRPETENTAAAELSVVGCLFEYWKYRIGCDLPGGYEYLRSLISKLRFVDVTFFYETIDFLRDNPCPCTGVCTIGCKIEQSLSDIILSHDYEDRE